MMKKYNLTFKGYWRDCNRSGLPAISGIYLVYKCLYNQKAKAVKLIELMYIGQADNIRARNKEHEKRDAFLKECKGEETLCYSVAEVDKANLNIVENALIFAQKPRLNEKCKDIYNYEPAELHLEGKCKFMKHLDFTIK